jgi:O-antigen ligase
VSVRDAAVKPRRSAWRRKIAEHRTLPDDLRVLVGGGIAVFLMIFWAVDDGGFDPGTWYWGALVLLACLAGVLWTGRAALATMPRSLQAALVLFGLYVAWSYLSMSWAAYAGFALQGSNRALLYLVVFALMAVLPWRRATALLMLGAFAAGLGVVAIAFLFRFALGDHVPELFIQGRLASPTGYINSTAALYTIGALTAVALAARRELPGVVRGLMLAFASAELMLAVTVQSRGWLFTLPFVGVWCVVVIAGRLRGVAAAILPAAGTLVAIHPMLRLFQISRAATLTHAAIHAGKIGLLSCAGVFAVGTLVSWIEQARARPPLAAPLRRTLGTLAVLVALAGMAGGLYVVSDHHPRSFISRQWNGFTHEPTTYTTNTHFDTVGSGRYDIWRSALEAFRAHPVGGLGQDNFGDWYLRHRNTSEEPLWTHSLELRLLASTGAVGFVLFAGFLIAALTAALAARRRGSLSDRMLVGAALLPLGVWLIHGSIDWFWEFPALSGPALGFLAMAGGLGPAVDPTLARAPSAARSNPRRAVWAAAGVCALLAATTVLGLPYLAVRELGRAEAASFTSPTASLADFHTAHQLNPFMSDPGELGGTVALVNGRPRAAAALFGQAAEREPGAWYAWLGRGLSASALGEVSTARRDLREANRIDARQPSVSDALRRVGTRSPLTIEQALSEISSVP